MTFMTDKHKETPFDSQRTDSFNNEKYFTPVRNSAFDEDARDRKSVV